MPDENNTTGPDAQTAGGETPPANNSITALPQWAQDVIGELRSENANRRVALRTFEEQQASRAQQELEDQQEWQKLADARKAELEQLKPFQTQVEQMEQTLKSVLDAQLADAPEAVKQAVETMPGSVQQKLEWFAQNRATLALPAAPRMDGGAVGDKIPAELAMTPEEQIAFNHSGLTRDQWNKHKTKERGRETSGNLDFLDRLRANNQE